MRNIARRPLTLALSLLLLSVLGAYGLGLAHGQPAKADASPLGMLRNLCTPHRTVCSQVVPGVLGATLLVGIARVRDGLTATAEVTTMDDHTPSTAAPQTANAPTTVAETLLGLVALVVACCWLAFPTRNTRMDGISRSLPTRSIPAHLCTPAP